jgi:hypothetical protein
MERLSKILKNTRLKLFVFMIISCNATGQTQPEITPNGMFDHLFDRFGNQLALSDLKVDGGSNNVYSIASTCVAGYFTLHFESGSIFDLSQPARTNICQVFTHLSSLIFSNIPTGGIHILCKNVSNGINLATGTPYYVFPYQPANPNQGIIDGLVYKALVSGVDPYGSLPINFYNTGGSTAGSFFHGCIEANPIAPWSFSVNTTNIGSGDYDFYGNMLHECMHVLGIHTLITNLSGFSAFGSFNNHFTRYDKFLCDHSGNPLLAPSNSLCPTTNLTFAPTSMSVIAPSVLTNTAVVDLSTCATAAKYIGPAVTLTVYTPDLLEPGSSLSHFEDMCSGVYSGSCVPTPTTPGANNLLFVTANFASPGPCYVKRYLKDEERLVLCDLGYSVNSTYGGTVVAGSSYSYGAGPCSPTLTIFGHNDGLSGNNYTITTLGSSAVISHSTLLLNDLPASGLEVACLELVYNNGTLTPGSTDFTVQAPTGSGVVTVKYIPKDIISGQFGNATYVFIQFVPPGCVSCGIVNNGGFEYTAAPQNSLFSCGDLDNTNNNRRVDCWFVYGLNYKAELLTTFCPGSPHELGVFTMYTTPPINTVTLGASTNTNALGLMYAANGSTGAVVNSLNTPLVNGKTYQVSFWVINYTGAISYNLNGPGNPVVLSLASSTAAINTQSTTPPGFPNGLIGLIDFTITAGQTWAQVTGTFVYSQTVAATEIVFGININQTQNPTAFSPSGLYYCFIDEFSIIELPGPNFSIPNNTICFSGSISDLAQFTGTTAGTFTGTGVTFDGTNYNFNSPAMLSPGVYGIGFTYSTTNCLETIYQSVIVENCCNSPSIPSNTLTTITGHTSFTGPMRFPNSFTIATGASLMLHGEFLISPGTSITVSSGAHLFLIAAHLYGCIDMWKGIVVLDGGRVTAQQYQGQDNLIEDAETAIAINTYTSLTNPILDISSTTFNKNRVSIDISNYPLTTSNAFRFKSTIFTCRDFTFAGTSWPQTGTSSIGLRYAANPTTGLAPPYDLQNAPGVFLKSPFNTEYAHAAIKLNGVGTTTGSSIPLIFNGPDLTPTTASDFLLFDGHEYFIKSTNSNLKLANSVFQNTQTFSISGTPTVGAAIDFSCSTLTSYTPGGGHIDNFELDLSASTPNVGNRFYDCHRGIVGNNPFSFKLENASIRSTHLASDANNTSIISTGQTGVFMRTNQVEDYIIDNNEFSNVTDGVVISLYPQNVMRPGFSYYPGPPQQYFMINAYIHTLSVIGNTFSPENNITFSGSTSGYVKNAISVSSDNYNMTAVVCGCTGIHIENNEIYRALNGISLNSVNPYTVTCKNVGVKKIIQGNRIILEEDNIFGGITQRGISFMNSVSEPMNNGQRLQLVKSNTITVFGSSSAQNNQNISLYYGFNNGGAGQLFPTPHILCNDLKNANKGFVFEGPNRPASWRGNKMEDLSIGMGLYNSGEIGQQGDATHPIDNEWNGSWGSNNGTYVDLPSNANNSPLYLQSNSLPWFPPNNFGAAPVGQQYSSFNSNLLISSSGTYVCNAEGNYTLMNSPLPKPEDHPNDESFYIASTLAYRYLALNDSMKTAHGDLEDFYNDMHGSSFDKFMQAEMKINERSFIEAQNILNTVNQGDFNSVETNYYNFYTLSLKYKIEDNEFTAEDLNALKTLAALCPGTNGSVIYQARALYLMITGTVFNSTDACGDTGERFAPHADENESGKAAKWDVDLFPNPNNGNFAIVSKNEKEILEVTIHDVNGKELFRKQVQTNKHYHVLDLFLMNGLYFVTIKNEENESVTKKMGIAK